MELPKHIYIIGAGGVTSYFLPAFIKTVSHATESNPRIHVVDGDALESRNLNRQLFDGRLVEKNKAKALVEMYKASYSNMAAVDKFFGGGSRLVRGSLIFVFVDNHPARRTALSACDRFNCAAIFAANEYTDSQAFYYDPTMRGSPLDPRVRYPEILSDESNDPMRPRGCNEEESLNAAPQLAIANFACASHALQLFWFYFNYRGSLEEESRVFWPIEHSNNFNRLSTRTEGHYAKAN